MASSDGKGNEPNDKTMKASYWIGCGGSSFALNRQRVCGMRNEEINLYNH